MAASLENARAGLIPYCNTDGTVEGYFDLSKAREFNAQEKQHLEKMSALMKKIVDLEAIEAAADRDILAAEKQIAAADKQIAAATRGEQEAAKRETAAAKRELEAASRLQEADKQLLLIDSAQKHIDNALRMAREIQLLIKKQQHLNQTSQTHEEEAKRLGAEADKSSMLKALSILVFPQYKSGSEATKTAEVKQTREFVTSYSDKIVASHANRDWYVIRNKSPHLTSLAISNLIVPVISDPRLPRANGLTLDFSGFTDEIEVDAIVGFIQKSANLRQITFGQLSDNQLVILAKNVAAIMQAKGASFIKFTNEGTSSKFTEALKNSQATSKPSKALPAVPPGKNPILNTPPVTIAPAGSNVPQPLVPNRGSPPKSQA